MFLKEEMYHYRFTSHKIPQIMHKRRSIMRAHGKLLQLEIGSSKWAWEEVHAASSLMRSMDTGHYEDLTKMPFSLVDISSLDDQL